MSIDLSGIQQGISSVAGLILVSPGQNLGILEQSDEEVAGTESVLSRLGITPPRKQGFLFHVPGEDRVELTSDITDHATEDNETLQDQIALKPEIVSVQGYIGELNNVPPAFLLPLKTAADKLAFLGPYVPALSAAAIRAYNNASQVYANAMLAKRAAVEALSLIGIGSSEQTKQQEAYVKFYGWWSKRQLFTVQTPWAVFKDMAILSLRATQDESTSMVTDFEITFKKVRFAKTLLQNRIGMGRAQAGFSEVIDLGVNKPVLDIGAAETGLV